MRSEYKTRLLKPSCVNFILVTHIVSYGAFLKWGTSKSSILDWDFPWNKQSSFWGTTITMETPISIHIPKYPPNDPNGCLDGWWLFPQKMDDDPNGWLDGYSPKKWMVIFPSDYGHRPYDFWFLRSDLKHWSRARQAPTPEAFAGIHRGLAPWRASVVVSTAFHGGIQEKRSPKKKHQDQIRKKNTHCHIVVRFTMTIQTMIVVHQAECRLWGKLGGFHPPCRARPLRLRCRDYLRLATARPNKDVVSCGEDGRIIRMSGCI